MSVRDSDVDTRMAQLELRLATAEQRLDQLAARLSLRRSPRKLPGHPRPNSLHRTWGEFIESMQVLESRARARNIKPTKQALADLGNQSSKTITRTMAWYGLRDWPPSLWLPTLHDWNWTGID